jgi:hypothetical protein
MVEAGVMISAIVSPSKRVAMQYRAAQGGVTWRCSAAPRRCL